MTIGICVKNAEKTIEETIQSILKQDFPHQLMEVIIVDDGSEDNTSILIEKCISKMNMYTCYIRQKWKGLGPSRNLIIRKARGKYILWVDGDMTLAADYVRKLVDFMNENPEVGIAKGRYGIPKKGKLLSFLENASFVAVDQICGLKPTVKPIGTGGSIYRVKALKDVDGFDESIRGVGEDFDVEQRIRDVGWLTCRGVNTFFYEKFRDSWKMLWKEYEWHGRGGYLLFKKKRLALYFMTPVAGFFAGAYYSKFAYKVTRRKSVFLLPIQHSFKRLAWCIGFIKSMSNRRA